MTTYKPRQNERQRATAVAYDDSRATRLQNVSKKHRKVR